MPSPIVDFGVFDLKNNPFLQERQDLRMIDRVENMNKVRGIVSEFVGANTPGIMVIFGDYGMGKSFTLRKLVEEADGENWAGDGTQLLPVFLKAIEPEQRGPYLTSLFTRIMQELGHARIQEIISEINEPLATENSVFKVMQQVTGEDSPAFDWLVGRKLSAAELKKLGVRFTPSDYGEVRSLFFDFLAVLKSARINSLVILLDEWEFLISVVGRTKLWKIVREIQRLYDTFNEKDEKWQSSHSTVITVLATSAGAWYRFLEVAREISEKTGGGTTETFIRRIATLGRVELSPLKEEHVRELMISRMKDSRSKIHANSTYPFTDDYIRTITRVTHGIPSRVLSYSALILSEAVKEGAEEIDAAFGERVLRNYRLWQELVPAAVRKER